MKKKKVIIIEDDFDDFKDIRKYLDSFCDCYPDINDNDSDGFEKFISLFQRCLNSGEKISIKTQKKKSLINYLKKNGEDVSFIIDYALKKNDTENVTGKKFYETIINELYPNIYVPTLMLTGIDFNIDVLNRINNDLAKYRDSINKEAGNNVFEYFRKDFKSPSVFSQVIIEFINKTNSVPRKKVLEQNGERVLHPVLLKIDDILLIDSFSVSNVKDEIIEELSTKVNNLKIKVNKDGALLENNELENILKKFVPPHDVKKIKAFIKDISKF